MTEQRLRVGVVGVGWVAGEHIKAFAANPACEVVALCGRDAKRAAAKADACGVQAAIYADYDDLLRGAELDLVAICTPNWLHAEQAIKAAEAGKHVLIEKPAAITLDSLYAMQRAIHRAGVTSLVGFVLHWNPLLQMAKSLIGRGALGRVFYAEVDYQHRVGPEYGLWSWLHKAEYGGSAMLGGGSHCVDALRWLTGGEAVEVSAYAGSYVKELGYEFDTTTVALIKFADGALAKVSVSLDVAGPYNFGLQLFGTAGTLRKNQLFAPALLPGQTDYATIPTIVPEHSDVSYHPFRGEIAHLVDAIRTGTRAFPDIDDAVKTHEICFAADISAREGRPVRLPLGGPTG